MTEVAGDSIGTPHAEADGVSRPAALAREAAAQAAAKAAEVRKVVGEQAAEVRKVVGEQAAVARDWAADQTDVLRDTVQTRPFISVGVSAGTAFAAGLVLGVLLVRR